MSIVSLFFLLSFGYVVLVYRSIYWMFLSLCCSIVFRPVLNGVFLPFLLSTWLPAVPNKPKRRTTAESPISH